MMYVHDLTENTRSQEPPSGLHVLHFCEWLENYTDLNLPLEYYNFRGKVNTDECDV